MKKMKRVHTTSLYTLCLPFFPNQSLCLKLVLHHIQFPHPTNMQTEIPTPAHILTKPTLLIASTGYIITVTINFPEQMRPLVPDLKVENLNGGHWLQLEKAEEVNKILEEFIEAERSV